MKPKHEERETCPLCGGEEFTGWDCTSGKWECINKLAEGLGESFVPLISMPGYELGNYRRTAVTFDVCNGCGAALS